MGHENISISHNANVSNSRMFPPRTSYGTPIDRKWAERGLANTVATEMIQTKGASETHPALSPNDEFAEFESRFVHMLGSGGIVSKIDHSFVRGALIDGVGFQEMIGANPWMLGIVAGSDSHDAFSDNEEDNYTGVHGNTDMTPKIRLTSGTTVAGEAPIMFGTPGATGVWADENTREGIFDALKRKESFGTSGPLIRVRFFGGWDYAKDMADAKDFAKQGYAGGVPMGGDLPAKPKSAKAPNFAVWTLKDPEPAPDVSNASTTAQADAVAEIKKLGGNFSLYPKSGEVILVYLQHTQITDEGLALLNGLTSLGTLSLEDTQITDAGLEHLKGLTNLRILSLEGTQITDAGLEHLKVLPSLTSLTLSGTQFTDAGLEHLKGLTSLRVLKLSDTQITGTGRWSHPAVENYNPRFRPESKKHPRNGKTSFPKTLDFGSANQHLRQAGNRRHMESDEFQATIIDGSAAASVHGDPSVDVSRANVDFVVGDRPQFADETADLLRNRLRAAALALTVILSAAFVGNLLSGTYSLWWLRAIILLSLGASWIALRSQRAWTLTQLRAIESTIFGVVVVQASAMMWARMAEFAADGDAMSVIAIKYLFLGAWCLLILVYGIFMPNTWKRGAVIMLPVALLPYLSLALQRWLAPEVDAILAAETFAAPIPLPLVAALVGVYGTHIINSARREAFKARQFGQYRLLEKIGSGGMGEVYKAEHVLLKRPCAMKLIRPESEADLTAIAHFEKEVKATAKLTHWNTVEIYDYGHTEDGTFYYVMELLPGLSLEDLAERYGPLPPERVVHLLRQVCGALHEAHAADLIHRDIKPANIFAAQRGGVFDVAKLLDFGLVKERATVSSSDGQVSTTGSFSGTPLYMSPEQAMAYEDVDGRADLYSLGAVAYYLLTGRPPFAGTNVVQLLDAHATKEVVSPSTLRLGIPSDLEHIILKCLSKEPSHRFPDAISLERALAQCEVAGAWTVEQAAAWWGEQATVQSPSDANPSSPSATDPFGATVACTPDVTVSDADDRQTEQLKFKVEPRACFVFEVVGAMISIRFCSFRYCGSCSPFAAVLLMLCLVFH